MMFNLLPRSKNTIALTATLNLFLGTASVSAEQHAIPLTLDPAGRPMVDAMIADHGPYRFVIDTGAPMLFVYPNIPNELGWAPVDEILIASPGGSGIPGEVYDGQVLILGGYQKQLDQIVSSRMMPMAAPRPRAPEGAPRPQPNGGAGADQQGEQPQRPPRAQQMPQPGQEQQRRPAMPMPVRHGTLGLWAIDDHVIGMDFGASALTIDTEGRLEVGADHVVPLVQENKMIEYPEFEISFGAEVMLAHIDTGSPGTLTVNIEWKDKLPLKTEPEVIGRARLADSERVIWRAQFDGVVTIAGHELVDPQVIFMDGVRGVNIGSRIFQGGSFRFDLKNQLVEILITS